MNKFILYGLATIGVIAVYRWAKEQGYIGEAQQPEQPMADKEAEQPAEVPTISQDEATAIAGKILNLNKQIPPGASTLSQQAIENMKGQIGKLLEQLASNGYRYKEVKSPGDGRTIAQAIKETDRSFTNE